LQKQTVKPVAAKPVAIQIATKSFATKSLYLPERPKHKDMKTGSLRALGLSQQDLAMLLGVSRSHLSLCEIGRRSLPAAALARLSRLTRHMQSLPAKKTAPDRKEIRQHIEPLLRENEYRRASLQRKIDAMERRQAAAHGLSHLAKFVAAHSAGGEGTAKGDGEAEFRFDSVGGKAAMAMRKDHGDALMKLQLEMERLEAEQAFFERKME
jgi:transcriptional regulator with XRE-family HTH domain